MSDQVRELIASFDALSESDKPVAAAEILRRAPRITGDLGIATFDVLADELFLTLDSEETARAEG